MCPVLQRPLAIVKSLYESVCGAVFMLLEKKMTIQCRAKRCSGCFEATMEAVLNMEVFVNQPIAHAELIASYKKVAADAAKKTAAVLTSSSKGPGVLKTVSETAAKAVRRRDVIASKLVKLGIALPE
jgi:hypothetical protein